MPTIGVSIAVPEPAGSVLQRYRVALGDESARRIPTHITLVPPVEVPDAELDQVSAHLERAAAASRPFEVLLRGTGTFRPVSPVVFIGVAEGIAGCELLATAVRAGPLAAPAEFPYHPHVTVAHDLPEARLDQAFEEMAEYRAAFEVSEFWLYHQTPGAGWVPTRAFALGAES